MEKERNDDLQGETDEPYIPNIKPVIVPDRIGSNVVNLGGDAEAVIKTTSEADSEKRPPAKKKKPRRFGRNQR